MPHRAHARAAPARRSAARPAFSCLFLALLTAQSASAIEIDTGNPDFKLRWDNTVRYTAAVRMKERSPGLAVTVPGAIPGTFNGPNNINQDDGDNNFGRGLVSSRVDLLSEMDLAYQNLGARVSAAAWYDQVYNRNTDNTTATANFTPASQFHPETRKVMGRKAELLDAFVYGRFTVGEAPVTVRLGRHTLLWGESLFFGANGIAGGMAPIDIIKATSVPNSQFKEIGRATGKLSGQVQISENATLGAYIAYEWDKSRVPASGSYLSTADVGGSGGSVLRVGPNRLNRRADLDAKDSGQGGVQLRIAADSIDTEFGLYYIRFHALTPSNLIFNGPPPVPTTNAYRFVYHEGTEAFGLSAAKTVGAYSLAGEVSYRKGQPLASSSQVSPGFLLNNNTNPGYALGETAHAQFSWLASLGPNALWQEASFVGEVAWNQRVKFTRNAQMANPNATKSAAALRVVLTPTYRQALPGLDVSPSIGVGYTAGRSSALGSPAFGVDKGGDASVGVGLVYLNRWSANLNYVHYLGKEGGFNDNAGNAQFKQAQKDRNFLSLSLRTTF